MKTGIQSLILVLGISLAAPALAAPRSSPSPQRGARQAQSASYTRQKRPFDRLVWNDAWTRRPPRGLSSRLSRLFQEAVRKIDSGRKLQQQGRRLLSQAQRQLSVIKALEAHLLIDRGEARELEGRNIIRQLRA